MNDGNLFTIRHHYQQTHILLKIEINGRGFYCFFSKHLTRDSASDAIKLLKLLNS